MLKFIVGSGAVPVLDPGRNIDCVSGIKLPRGFSPLLIISSPRGDEQYLTAFAVDMPVVAAGRLKGDVPYGTPFVVSILR